MHNYSNNLNGLRWRGWLCAAMALALASCASIASAQWESTPYEVLVLVTGEQEPAALEGARRIVERLPAMLPGVGGQAWRTTVRPAFGQAVLLPLAAGHAIDANAALALLGEKERPDKLLVVAARAREGERVFAQEVDVRLRLAGPVAIRERRQRSAWEEPAVEAIVEAFRPLARVERGTATEVAVIPRAVRLLDGEHPPLGLPPGSILQPWVRRNDRLGDAQAKDILQIPWTYLTVGSSAGRRVNCSVLSGMGNPLGGRTSARLERLAILVRSDRGGTTLQFKARLGEKGPLPGLEVVEAPPAGAVPPAGTPPAGTPPPEPVSLGFTDHRGEVTIAPIAGQPLRLLLVKHGRETLARLPLVPGAVERVTAFLADDRPRLDAEGYLLGVQQQVIDSAARREILAAQARRYAEDGKTAQIEPLLIEMRALPTRDAVRQQLAVQQGKFQASDPLIQKKIEKMFLDLRTATDKHLDPALIEKIARNLAQPAAPRPPTP